MDLAGRNCDLLPGLLVFETAGRPSAVEKQGRLSRDGR
jgi:hypothetical protein